ncbi:MAG TPA: hypothetical protein VHQ96_05715 [Gaiellaceae bacterium]|nr:hypothetical protein [Gaiellaceae bacterium]
MTELAFLSPGRASAEAVWRSPLQRALRGAPPEISDLSLTGKIEVRGDLDAFGLEGIELVRITPTRGLVLCDFTKTVDILETLQGDFLAIDVSGTLAGLQVQGETLMRRITDIDLDDLPAAGAVSHIQALVLRDGDTFRLFFGQEYSDYLAEVVIDAHEGLRA